MQPQALRPRRSCVHIYEGFQHFIDECQTIAIDKDDCQSVYSFILDMESSFDSEDDRVSAAMQFLRSFMSVDFVTAPSPDSAMPDISLCSCCLIEVKNEPGSTNCDPFQKVTRYYLSRILESCKNACYLVIW